MPRNQFTIGERTTTQRFNRKTSKAALVKVPGGLLEKGGKVWTWYLELQELIWNHIQSVGTKYSRPKIERLLRTSPEVWKELKTTSGWIPSRNQQRKDCSRLCLKQKGTGWDVQDRTRGSVTKVNPMSGNGRGKWRIRTKASSQSLDRGDKDFRRNTGWRMSIWMQSRIVTDKWRITNSYLDKVRNSYG
jgi:hypothetical protein